MTVQAAQLRFVRTLPGKQRRGAMLVFICVLMILFMLTVVFSIDLAHMHLARTQLRSATDAAAKAAAQELATTQDIGLARAKAKSIASQNDVIGKPLLLADSDIVFGQSRENRAGKFVFQANTAPNNSIQVNGDRSRGSRSGSVSLLFGGFFGVADFQPRQSATATFLERDIVLVVDRSGSMRGQKAADLVSAIQIFVSTLQGTSVDEVVGLASYSSSASEDVQLTVNLASINTAMSSMNFSGFTSISKGMKSGKKILDRGRSRDFVERTMIVMTDGKHNRPTSGREPQNEAAKLAADKVFIHTITFGAGADIARMQEIATIGSGKHFHAANGSQLRDIYREIALTLSTMITQ